MRHRTLADSVLVLAVTGSLLILLGACSGGRMGSRQTLWSPAMPASLAKEAPDLDLRELERLIYEEVNRERSEHDRSSLAWSDTIAFVARAHSEDMAVQGYFGHIDKEGNSALERAAQAGVVGPHRSGGVLMEGLGENLFATHRYSEFVVSSSANQESYQVNWKRPLEIAKEAVHAWMNSAGHRENLLSSAYRKQGIGIALGSNGTLFVTQNLY